MDSNNEKFLMDQISATLFSLANKIQAEGDKQYKRLTSRQLMALVAIAHLEEEKTTINNIAKKLGTTKQSAQQLVNTLKKQEFVEIVPSKEDKRAVNVKITDYGKQTMIDEYSSGVKFNAYVFKDFSVEEMQILWCLLKKLYRFDGREQDGLEGDVNIKFSSEQIEEGNKALKEAEAIREQGKNRSK